MKDEKNESEVTLTWEPLLTPCPSRPTNLIYTKEIVFFYNRNFWTIFCWFWCLLGRMEKEEGQENEDEKKKEKWKNKRKEKWKKKKKKKKKVMEGQIK